MREKWHVVDDFGLPMKFRNQIKTDKNSVGCLQFRRQLRFSDELAGSVTRWLRKFSNSIPPPAFSSWYPQFFRILTWALSFLSSEISSTSKALISNYMIITPKSLSLGQIGIFLKLKLFLFYFKLKLYQRIIP